MRSSFFGAMDGASKFVRGDAIAGLLITFINIIGGIVIGMAQKDLSMGDAATTYTLLTIGDGLVSQIPALVVSTAAGLLVSKAGVDGAADKALFGQLSGYPKALGMSAFVMLVMAILPGVPMLPFLLLSAIAGGLAWNAIRSHEASAQEAAQAEIQAAAAEVPAEEPISNALHLDELRLELGYGLLPLISEGDGDQLTDQIKALRRQLASDMGFVMPSVRILDNMQLDGTTYVVKVKEVEAGKGEVYVGQHMVMDPQGQQVDLPGAHTTEPTFGLPATWIDSSLREEAAFKGYTVVDPATVISTHLTEILKANMAELLSYAEVQKLLDDLPSEHQKLIEDIIPAQISVTGVQRILQSPLSERISIRDLATILEGIAEATSFTSDTTQLNRTCARAAQPSDLRQQCRPGRLCRPGRHVTAVGAEVRRIPGRPGRRAPARHGADRPAGVHHQRARPLRGSRPHGREPGSADQPRHPPLCPLDHRTLPAADRDHVSGRDSSAGEAEDRRPGMTAAGRRSFRRRHQSVSKPAANALYSPAVPTDIARSFLE